jgi:hypothetical protein
MEQAVKTQSAEDEGFSLRVTYRDEKSGQVTHKDPYILRVLGEERRKVWERPVGSGNLWNKKGEAIGRWVVDPKTKKGKFVEGAKHVEFVPPMTEDQKLAKSLIEKDVKIAELEKELALIKAEKEKKGS